MEEDKKHRYPVQEAKDWVDIKSHEMHLMLKEMKRYKPFEKKAEKLGDFIAELRELYIKLLVHEGYTELDAKHWQHMASNLFEQTKQAEERMNKLETALSKFHGKGVNKIRAQIYEEINKKYEELNNEGADIPYRTAVNIIANKYKKSPEKLYNSFKKWSNRKRIKSNSTGHS